MKLVKIKKVPKVQEGGYAQDFTGLGTYIHQGPVEMHLSGQNPIVGGPVDVFAQDAQGKQAFIPAGQTDPVMMNGNVKEIPIMKKGGKTPITMNKNKTVPQYTAHKAEPDEPNLTGLNEPSQKDISSTMKEVPEEDANVEAEKGEIVMKPGLDGIYKVGGKTHKQGGTNLLVEDGSFIFSNDPILAITKSEAETFGFDEFKSKSKKLNTPAKVLSREVKAKEYNGLVHKLMDKKTDHITKNTAALMLEKYQEKIGQVAYLQEAKKRSEIPDFAMGTAPFIGPEIDQAESKEKQFAQKGGIYMGARTPGGTYGPRGQNTKFQYERGMVGMDEDLNPNGLLDRWKEVGINGANIPEADFQRQIYDWTLKNDPNQVMDLWRNVGLTNLGRKNISQLKNRGIDLVNRNGKMDFANVDNLSDDDLSFLRDAAYADGMLGLRTLTPPRKAGAPLIPNISYPASPAVPDVQTTTGKVPTSAPIANAPVTSESIPSLGYDIKGNLTNSQLAHLGYLGLNAMSVSKYYPKREQVDLPEVNLNTINEQPYINDINNQSFQAYRSLNNGDPRMARVNASNIYGRGLDAISQTRGNIDNQNNQIQNQENLTNLQQRTNQVLTNTQYDDKYFDQVQTTRQNFDNEKRYANNQVFSTLNQYQSQADQLAWGLASVNKYGRRLVTDPKTGKKYYKPVPLYEATQNGIRYNSDVADLNLATGADRLNSVEETLNVLKQNGININDHKQMYAFGTVLRSLGNQRTPIYGNNPMLPNQ